MRSPNSRWWLTSHRKSLQLQGPLPTSHFFGSTRPRRWIQRRNRRRKMYELQFHPHGTRAASLNCFLPSQTSGLSGQNRCKIGRLIQAFARSSPRLPVFWNPGARWFVVTLYVLEQPSDELQQFFGGSIIRNSKVFRRVVRAKIYAVRIAFFRRRFADSLKQGQPRIR